MATELEAMPSPVGLPEAMTTHQVGLDDASQMMAMGDMSQSTAIGTAEVSIKMLMSSKVCGCVTELVIIGYQFDKSKA